MQHRIDRYYWPYHRRLAEIIEDNLRRFAASWHLSCHCIASVGPHFSHDKGQPRADICLSDRHGTTAEPAFLAAAIAAFKVEGFSVTVNDPFVGQESIRMHADPGRRRNSLQIEMNRGLYMDEAARTRVAGLAQVRGHLTELARQLAAYARAR